ncbi:MAG: restriction endonuclease [Pseudomonadales bacterium]
MMPGIVASQMRPSIKPPDTPELLLQTELVELGDKLADGTIVTISAIPWMAIYRAIKENPNVIYEFSKYPRMFEEFLAAAYDKAGWDEVILTPRSNDGGRDVIAIKKGLCSIRILDQAKAYSPNHLVTHDDVRAMLGVLQIDSNSSKAIITTTSDFQPTISSNPELQRFMPYRLELRSGQDLWRWIDEIAKNQTK